MQTFAALAALRREWIDQVLRPWCQQAPEKELRLAEHEWGDIAGRVDPQTTLWTWAWGRFPVLVHEGPMGVNETHPVRVHLKDGTTIAGYPDNRQSVRGRLVLLCPGADDDREFDESRPVSIDEIDAVERIE